MKSLKRFLKEWMANKGFLPANEVEFGFSRSNGDFFSMMSLAESMNKVSSFAQQGEDLIVERLMKRRLGINSRTYQGFYVDIGAYHPISHSTSYSFYRMGWHGICVDISEKSCQLLRRYRPRDHVYHCAIAHSDKKNAFSSIQQISLINEAIQPLTDQPITSEMIDARSINSLLRETGREQRIDYLNIDVEGAEIEALQGLDFVKYSPRIISIEIHEKTLEAGLAHPTARFLVDHGYVCLACAAITYIFVKSNELT